AGTDTVAPRVLHPCAAADLLAIDVDGVHLLDDAELDGIAAEAGESASATRSALASGGGCGRREGGGIRFGDIKGLAEVDKGRTVGHAKLGEAAGYGDGLPRGVVVVGRGPVLLHADVVVVIPVLDEVAVLRAFVLGDDAVVFRDQRIEVVDLLYRVDAHKGLGRHAADRGDDEADGDVGLLLYLSREVERDCGDATGGVRCDDVPRATNVVDGVVGRTLGNGKEADVGQVGFGGVFGTGLGLAQAELHVGLAAAEPDIADGDVFDGSGLVLAGDGHRIRATHRRRIDLRLPAAVRAGHRGGGFPGDLHFDLVTGIGPSPDRIRFVALQHHVVREECGHEGRRADLLRSTRPLCDGVIGKQCAGQHKHGQDVSRFHQLPFVSCVPPIFSTDMNLGVESVDDN